MSRCLHTIPVSFTQSNIHHSLLRVADCVGVFVSSVLSVVVVVVVIVIVITVSFD